MGYLKLEGVEPGDQAIYWNPSTRRPVEGTLLDYNWNETCFFVPKGSEEEYEIQMQHMQTVPEYKLMQALRGLV